MALTQSKKQIPLVIFVRLLVFFFSVVIFFSFYNTFLVDRNLEVLKRSLSNIALAETVGPISSSGPILQMQFLDELSSKDLDIETFMQLSYSNDVLEASSSDRPVDDIVAVMEEIIRKKESQRPVLLIILDNFSEWIKKYYKKIFKTQEKIRLGDAVDSVILDNALQYEKQGNLTEAAKLYGDIILEYPDSPQTPSVMLRLAYTEQKLNKIKQAEDMYKELISRFPSSAESENAKLLLARLEQSKRMYGKIDDIQKTIINSADEQKQELYYKLAIAQLAAGRLEDAKASFKNAILGMPDNEIAQDSYLRIGICEKILGNYDASKAAFDKLAELTNNPELKMLAKYQSGEISRRNNEYSEMVKSFHDISESDAPISKPALLFFIGSTYLFDMKDFLRAKGVFEKLREEFPALNLVYPGTDFVVEYTALDVPPMLPDEVAEMMSRTWLDLIIPNRVLTIIDKAALEFATRITEGVNEIVILEEYDVQKGDYVTIDLTKKRLNNYLKKWFPIGNDTRVWDVSMQFEGNQRLNVLGTAHLPNNIKLNGLIKGRFKIVKMSKEPYWQSERGQENFLLYIPDKFVLSGIPLPRGIMNIILRASIQQFNKNFPLRIAEFRLDKDNIVFSGPIREDLKAEIQAKAYGLRHMEAKDADSGFIYGRRKGSVKY